MSMTSLGSMRYRSAANAPLCRAADQLSGIAAGLVADLPSGEALYPRNIFLNSVGIAGVWAQALGGLLPTSLNRCAWLETGNRLQAYRLFASADLCFRRSSTAGEAALTRPLKDAEGSSGDLRAAMEHVCRFEPYSKVWALEGIGYYYGQQQRAMSTYEVDQLPRHTLVPLHTGAGLALAQDLLATAETASVMRGRLRDFPAMCADVAVTGYEEPVLEALGLVAVTLYPQLVRHISREIGSVSGSFSDLFWHGVGRGLYFTPLNVLPLAEARQRSINMALNIPADESGRNNTIAGLIWAMTLVNIRDPEVIASWLREALWDTCGAGAAMNGLTSAAVVWLAALPEDRFVDQLCDFEPSNGDPALTRMWNRTVTQSCRDARWLHHRQTRNGDIAATVFRVRPLRNRG